MQIDKILTFTISSEFGFFKKPDVNDPIFFTFNIIPKPTLLGILGAILGFGGYSQQKGKYPDFYEKLKDLLIGIRPLKNKGVFAKTLIKYNNTVGYANQDGVLNIIEQTLINPKYEIFVGLDEDNELHKRFFEYFQKDNIRSEYIPYMGKNEFHLNIENVEYVKAKRFDYNDDFQIYTIFPNIKNKPIQMTHDDGLFSKNSEINIFYFFENLPVGFDELNQYVYKEFVFSNAYFNKECEYFKSLNLFDINGKIVCLF